MLASGAFSSAPLPIDNDDDYDDDDEGYDEDCE
jgi:hypothetical protein